MGNSSTLVIGMDVSDRWTEVCGLPEAGGDVALRTRIRTRRKDFATFLHGTAPSRVVMEVGPHSRWMSQMARESGHEVLVANARKLRFIYASTNKSDVLDAEQLGRVGRLDPELLHPVRHRSEACQDDLSLLHSRDALVKIRTQLINRMRGVSKAAGWPLPSCDAGAFHRKLGPLVREQGKEDVLALLRTLEAVASEIAGLDERLETLAKTTYPETEVLRQVCGVGPLTSLGFVLALEDPDRFARSRDVGPFLGLTPGRSQTGGHDPQLGITKAGNPMLRRLLIQVAQQILQKNRPDCDLKRFGLAIARKGGKADKGAKRRAVVAVARKLAVLLHALWKTGAVYEPLRQAA